MNLRQNEGILYDSNFQVKPVLKSLEKEMPLYFEIPHKSIKNCVSELYYAFSIAGNIKADYVFVLAPLHKGPINKEDKFTIYTYEDCFVEHPLLTKNDCICAEEFSYEIAYPFIRAYFPNAKTTAFFAPSDDAQLKIFVNYLKENFKNSVFFVSNNKETNCSQMWKQAF